MAMLLLVSSLGIGVLAESRVSKQTAIRTEEAAQEYVQQYAREISAGKTEYSVTGGQRPESFSDKKVTFRILFLRRVMPFTMLSAGWLRR